MTDTNPISETPRPTARPLLWYAVWLAVMLAAPKIVYLGLPKGLSPGQVWAWAVDLAVAIHRDLLFGLLAGAAGAGAVLLTRRWGWAHRVVWTGWLVLAAICVFYAVAAMGVYAVTLRQLTYHLLYMGGSIHHVRSSISEFVTLPLVAMLAGAPLVFLAAGWASVRYLPPRRQRDRWVVAGALAVVVLGVNYRAHRISEQRWDEGKDQRLAASPHWVMLRSLGGSGVRMDQGFPREFLADFSTFGERQPASRPASQPERPAPPRNVIIFVLESTPTRYMSVYGSPFPTTPNLEKEQPHSLTFTNYYTPAGCTAGAVVPLSLSVYPPITFLEYTREYPHLRGATLAEVLRPHGYRTAFLTAADADYANIGPFLQGRGFDLVEDYRKMGSAQLSSWGGEDRCLVDSMVRWIDQDRSKPFFLMGWTNQTHSPYQLVPGQPTVAFEEDGKVIDYEHQQRFLNALLEADRQIGRLLEALRQRGLADDTLVVITGDHGQAFGKPHHTFFHNYHVFQENVNVPCILWNPRLFNGQRLSTIGGHVDLNPTIVDLLGLSPPPPWQGQSLLSNDRPPRTYFVATADEYVLGVREGRFKYIYNVDSGREQLFDAVADPEEQHDVARANPALCQRLNQRLAAWVDYQDRYMERLKQ